ncbi:Acetyl esterase [Fructilactobacillus sanfranciscensis]
MTPEVTAKQLLADCQKAVTYVSHHAEDFKIDSNRIYVSGDSAGGNLAAVMSYLDAIKGDNVIKGQVLIYPMVDNRSKAQQIDLSGMPENQKEMVRNMDAGNVGAIDILKDIYVDDDHQMTDKTISPITMSYAEFDCLNDQGYQYACSVAKHRNDTTYLKYVGMMHAFIDKVGIVPQIQDVIREMALWAKR